MREVVKVSRKLSPLDAAKKVESTFPGVKTKEMYDYDKEWYMAMATDKEDTDYNSPYYLVGKTNGRVCSFSPLVDLSKFNAALSHPIEFNEVNKSK